MANTSLPAVYRPNDDRWNAARSCQKKRMLFLVATMSLPAVYRPNDNAEQRPLERRTLVPISGILVILG